MFKIISSSFYFYYWIHFFLSFLNIALLGRSEKKNISVFTSLSSGAKPTDTKLLCFVAEAGLKTVYPES